MKNTRNAMALSEGKMNGVRKSIASPQRMPILMKPLTNLKSAHIRANLVVRIAFARTCCCPFLR